MAGILRLLVCGSVDDGKSTLIGRLLTDAGLVPDDERARTPDFAALLDGLQAEREQGITIDVAYRHFSTRRRRFLVADAPGHEQYTRNMATGASVSDAAVMVVDAERGIRTQTRRHAVTAALFGIREVVLAVNKMDLVGRDETSFRALSAEWSVLADELGLETRARVPVAALHGENLVTTSPRMPWYAGPPLLARLETLAGARNRAAEPFRFPVQWVNRKGRFRGYAGTIAAGRIRPGDPVVVAPAGIGDRIARIVTRDGDLEEARAGQAVTLTLEGETDIGRGDLLGDPDSPPGTSSHFRATLLWMDAEPMLPGRSYWTRFGAAAAGASITSLRHVLEVDTLGKRAGKVLEQNEIGEVHLALDRPLAFDPGRRNPDTGSFLLIDPYSKRTVGAGAVAYGLRRAQNLSFLATTVGKTARAALKGQRPAVVWFTGLSASGKSTIADLTEKKLHALGRHTFLLDGDNFRRGLGRDLGFTPADRVENVRRLGEIAALFVEAGLIVLVAAISPFRGGRRAARRRVGAGEFVEVFVDAPLSVCESRDPKGLYRKARAGEFPNFTGLDSPYEPPENPELHLDATEQPPEAAADEVIRCLRRLGIL